jgi:hypothetical protein
MEPVPTRKLNRGTVYVFGTVTDIQFGFYFFMTVVIYLYGRGFVGNALLQFLVPLPIIGFIVHPITQFVKDLDVMDKISVAMRFAFKADRYVLRPDPQPLPHIAAREK